MTLQVCASKIEVFQNNTGKYTHECFLKKISLFSIINKIEVVCKT